ncbi:long-chain acyl-CoA synthetase [Bacillus toyonensis]|uniref:class I adenylate-forming enzyme family protein n=1 Tax=Bacillus toyonensis TaxID=155322 RepID=UPI000BEF67F1|nr:class I adenylate-forming enzyme family protein [Bacillus toyonensis]PEO65249.1 long-chain acyl-CoA synthetase [Bacillus toyonensis]PFX82738.1 long-chain acyl-CoA synthetase [Bacillus toyonensis]PFX96836.1 long-chain acyl-CoA synthetase [Bacillus toyonensis]PGB12340.1 long-chain acyl-CoA synthetase [Bacillus toyonensis]PHF51520.1 long-chain acyl-CoA synthetase [Bacillus toyonensis]
MKKDKNLLSVYELLETVTATYGEKEAIYDVTRRITYKQLKQEVDCLATAFKRLGVGKADRIAVSLPNWSETVVIYFAAAKLGAIIVPFNPKYKSYEIEYILESSAPKLLMASGEFEKNFGFEKVFNKVRKVITVRFSQENYCSYEQLMRTETMNIEPVNININVNEDLFCILYTSGTTGTPKGVMVTHRAVVQSAQTIGIELHCTQEDVFIISAPLFHIFGMAINMLCAVAMGGRIILQEKFHPRETLQLIEQEKVTIQKGVPTMFIKELELEDFDKYDLSSLRAGLVGAAPISVKTVTEIRERMGINLCQSFGITETVSITMTSYDDTKQNITETLGKAIPGVTLKIVDENRVALPPGEVGEIAVKGFGVMKGYYNMPEQTKQVLDNEDWYYSGDLGTLDSQGYLRFVGRKKEMIIRGGLNVYPQEIEAVIMKHPKVIEAAVIGLPDKVLGEIACAVIRLKNGVVSTEEEIKLYLKERMAIYKLPEKVIFTEEFPVTASGKIQKLKLREQVSSNSSPTV